jgi:TRAP-type C4-dicarboxylate transport system permease large subunit
MIRLASQFHPLTHPLTPSSSSILLLRQPAHKSDNGWLAAYIVPGFLVVLAFLVVIYGWTTMYHIKRKERAREAGEAHVPTPGESVV